MKRITSILSLVIVLAMAFSMTAFAAANTNEFTITTDKTSVAAGEKVIVNVEVSGDFVDVALVQLSVKFDDTKFSTTTSGRAPWGFDKDWYNDTKDGNPANLGYINTPSFGANPANQINVLWLSTDGYYIDDAGELYGEDKTTTAAKIVFTAKEDVAVIDASCFEVLNAAVSKESGAQHDVTVNQLVSEDPAPSVNMVSTTEIVDVQKADTFEGEATDYQYGSAIGISGTTDGAIFKKMIWAITVGSDRLYSEAFDVSLEGDFKVAATFINGNKVDENNVEFSEAGAIFTDGVEDYFTNEADAANKAE